MNWKSLKAGEQADQPVRSDDLENIEPVNGPVKK